MSNASLELGGGKWGTKDGNLLGYASSTSSSKFVPREFAFTRGSDIAATRINSSGLIEKYRENLLLQSNQFDTTWTTSNSSVTSGQSGYDGSSDAWLLENTSTSFPRIEQAKSISGVVTCSIYAKAGTNNFLRPLQIGGSNAQAYFDLSNGTIANESNVIDAKIESVGSGWYRCSITFDGATTAVRIYSADAVGSFALGNTIIQDAQLEQGLVATSYLESGATTATSGVADNEPRIDYASGTASLLLEPQRTNSVGNSELINPNIDSTWKQLGVNTFTTNYGTSPEGKQNSTLIQFGGTNSAYQVYYEMNFSAGDYTTSIYAKGSGSFKYGIYDNTSILTDTITLTSEWQRFEVTKTALAASNGRGVWIYPNGDGNTIEVWGGQVEAGSYATSYIPTYGTSVTRSTDNMTGSPLSIYGLFGATEGSIFLEFTNPLPSQLANNSFYFTGLGGASSGYQRIRGYWQFYFPGLTFSPTGNLGNVKGHSKILAKWGNGSIKLFTDGVEEAASTYTGGDINMNGRLESIVGSYDFAAGDSRIKTMLFFSEAPTDDECIALTTL